MYSSTSRASRSADAGYQLPATAAGRMSVAMGCSLCNSITMTPVPTILTIADVERIAALAQLELTEEEKRLFTRQLADILAYAEQIQAIDTSGVPATAHVNAAQRTERDDEPRPCLPVEEAIANAPDAASDAGLFRVP